MTYLVSIQAPAPDEDGDLDGDVLVIDAPDEEAARMQAELPAGWRITDVTETTPDEDDELRPAEVHP